MVRSVPRSNLSTSQRTRLRDFVFALFINSLLIMKSPLRLPSIALSGFFLSGSSPGSSGGGFGGGGGARRGSSSGTFPPSVLAATGSAAAFDVAGGKGMEVEEGTEVGLGSALTMGAISHGFTGYPAYGHAFHATDGGGH